MLVSEIIDEVKEAIGKCNDAFAIKTITRAVQLLANKGLIDPLVGYFDFSVSDNWFVALPREVKTPLRVNINKQPSFSRARIYEFHVNSLGTQDKDEPGLSWSDRGYSPIQNAKALPGKLSYKVTKDADVGKTTLVTGRDENGRITSETLTGTKEGAAAGAIVFHEITIVTREVTSGEAFLLCNGGNVAAQYYGDEITPDYRVIKLSKAASAVRVMFRRQVFALKTLDDFIPMHSELAVIQACKAVRFLATDENDKASAALAMAENFLKEEQASREEHNTISSDQEVQTALDVSIYARDSIVVSDVYDMAAEIFGAIGKRKLFDKITTAIEILSNRGQWDARLGWVDVYSADNRNDVTYNTPQYELKGKGHGYFVLPRHVEIPVAINYNCGTVMPRNRWFEFHLNGDGGMMDRSTGGTWDDQGEVCICRRWPLNPNDPPKIRRALPLCFVAVPDDSVDVGTEVRLYGFERDALGNDVEVWRGGERGWVCPCVVGTMDPGTAAPMFTSITRITKGESQNFIRLFSTIYTPAVIPGFGTQDLYVLSGQVDKIGILVSSVTWGAGVALKEVGIQVAITSGDLTYHIYTKDADGADVMIGDGFESLFNSSGVPPLVLTFGTGTNTVTITFERTVVGDFGFERADATRIANTPPPAAAFWAFGDQFGFWYPDEVEPKYRAIKLSHSAPSRIRVAYRKRTPKISSLTEPIPLRSRFAIEQQMRAIKNAGDPALSAQFEAAALNYLRDERINIGPSVTGMFQFDESTSPGFTGNIQ